MSYRKYLVSKKPISYFYVNKTIYETLKECKTNKGEVLYGHKIRYMHLSA